MKGITVLKGKKNYRLLLVDLWKIRSNIVGRVHHVHSRFLIEIDFLF